MALGFPRPIKPDDPRLKGHETTYQASRGGWLKTTKKPAPGTPKKKEQA
ncbi:hypothetical protein [Streptomyces sp. NBC_00582]|nr:hypothetical protein [Streptomyces sp. NBC_00582]WUB64446.1 hypothetical protein OG852_30660 [Streptomyces sp. NBC_00582]